MRYLTMTSVVIMFLFIMGCTKESEQVEKWVNLSRWESVVYDYPSNGQGKAVWELSHDNQWATQKVNGDPTILVSDIDITGTIVEGSWVMKENSDDDLVGFVFGYQDPGHFYLLDWKKATQEVYGNGIAKQGVSIKVADADYSGVKKGILEPSQPFNGKDLWNTEGSEGKVTLLYYEETEGWEFDKEYNFFLEFIPGSFTLEVKDGERTIFSKIIMDDTYKNGKFGFYNFSQAPVIYKGFKTTSVISTQEFPWWILILGIVLIVVYTFVRKKKKVIKNT
ncbi:MAG: hypothetical protein U9R42_09520 [Bacteroidota bacterium]|nr:hypothetical protein [Bacteroidota bacterium]